MANPFWGAVENLNISGGEPTTRNDLPEMVEMFQRHLPRMRKIGINTTGLTPHRAIPMLTRIVEFCAENGSAHQHPRVARRHRRHPRPGARTSRTASTRPAQTIEAMQALSKKHDELLSSASPSTIFATNLDGRREHPRLGAHEEARRRVQHAAVHRRDAAQQGARGDDRLPGSAKKSSCASSSSIACRKNRC